MADVVFAMGCFLGAQAVFDPLKGIIKTEVGYAGGDVRNPTYEEVFSETTGHAEAVKVTYDPAVILLDELLDVFFLSHDPTALDRQGADGRAPYRSAVYYTDETEKEVILRKKEQYQHYFDKPIVTEVSTAALFYPAEEYHQKYFEKIGQGACTATFGSDEELWRRKLGEERYKVMRRRDTEPPFSGEYLDCDEEGIYRCAACGQKLFDSESKFQTSCGWPGFDRVLPDAVKIKTDDSHSMVRDEVVCARCESHLGHLFNDGPTETGDRFCINSVCLKLEKV